MPCQYIDGVWTTGSEPAEVINPFDGRVVEIVDQAGPKDVERAVAASRSAVDSGPSREPVLQQGFFFRPTVVDGCHGDTRVVREETFAPIRTVERFDTEDAIELANDTEHSPAGAVFPPTAGAPRPGWPARCAAARSASNDYHPYIPLWSGTG